MNDKIAHQKVFDSAFDAFFAERNHGNTQSNTSAIAVSSSIDQKATAALSLSEVADRKADVVSELDARCQIFTKDKENRSIKETTKSFQMVKRTLIPYLQLCCKNNNKRRTLFGSNSKLKLRSQYQ